MLDYVQIFFIVFHWLNLVQLYMRWRPRKNRFRRWWVKPHIINEMRNLFGAYQTLFAYFIRYDHEEFHKMTRMTPDQFELLHDLVGNRLQKVSMRRPLPTRLRLALTLNYLANGDSNRTTANFFRLGRSTTYQIIAEVCLVIWEMLSPLYLRRNNARDWRVIAQGFRVRWDFPNCIGAVDGKEIRIKKPPNSGSQYFNYKKFCSFKLLAACDAYYRFTWIDIGDYGSVSDISAFKHTEFYRALESNQADLPRNAPLPRTNILLPYCFVEDEIFTLKPYMMRPFSRHNGLNRVQKNFNYRSSRARNCIEDAFGILAARWQILHKRLDFKLDTSISIVQALVCLHNYILNEELVLEDEHRLYAPSHSLGGNRNNVPDEEDEGDEEIDDRPRQAVQQRQILTEYFDSEEGALRRD